MGIHFETRLGNSGGSGGSFFCQVSRPLESSGPLYQASRLSPDASAGKSGACVWENVPSNVLIDLDVQRQDDLRCADWVTAAAND